MGRAVAGALLALCMVASGCADDAEGVAGQSCGSDAECGSGRCVSGRCVTQPDAGDGGWAADCESGVFCGAQCCAAGERCAYDQCVVDLGPCETNDDCHGDSYCDDSKRCTPYGVPADATFDAACKRPIDIGDFTPAEQCHWPSSEPAVAPASIHVYGTPVVADLNLDADPNVLAPSIAVATFETACGGGILRVIDGRKCQEQAVLAAPEDRLTYATSLAIAELDGAPDSDGQRRPEIIGISRNMTPPEDGCTDSDNQAGVIAFGYAAPSKSYVRRWHGRRCDLPGQPKHYAAEWRRTDGVSVHDLDDDGAPEIVWDGFVYDANGCLLNPGWTFDAAGGGVFPVLVDVDGDHAPELVRADGIFRWDAQQQNWALESYWAPSAAAQAMIGESSFVAVADFGAFPGVPGDGVATPEIVVVSVDQSALDSDGSMTGTVRVMTIAGHIVFGPIALPHASDGANDSGGAPTIGDFDGDGRPEIGVAGGIAYSVFDLDCDDEPANLPKAGCDRKDPGLPRGILWSRPSQDKSSNRTGSSVFDFDADGIAEVVYRDECFLRIYRGTDGEVLFSQTATSGTGYEYPVVADVDGDFNSEIVVPLTTKGGCPAVDPIHPGTTAPSSATGGVLVVRDVLDRWASSRPIWNQHAYSITNVNDDATIPASSAVSPNHADPALNNFRMNAQGSLEQEGAADLTVKLASADALCEAATGQIVLRADVCNRGTNPAPDGANVSFHAGDPTQGGAVLCETELSQLLLPGECAEVSCAAELSGSGTEITVAVDPDEEVFECRDGNNFGLIPEALCVNVR